MSVLRCEDVNETFYLCLEGSSCSISANSSQRYRHISVFICSEGNSKSENE